MNNIFRKLSHMKDVLMSKKDVLMSKSGNIMNNVRKSVELLTAATALSMSSGAMAWEWHTVDTKGIWPEAFCMQKFGNKEWKLLVDDQWRNVLKPDKDLQYRGKYTQKPVASGQGDDTARSAARIVSTPRPQPHKEARANQISIWENSTGNIKKKNLAQTNSLTGPKKDPLPTNKLKVPENFDLDALIAQKMAEKIVSQVIQLKPEWRKNEELLCENPDSDKNSKIIKEVSQLDLGTLIAIPPKETFPKTQIGPTVPGNIFSIQEARALRKPLENTTAKQSSEKPIAINIKKTGFFKKLFGRDHWENPVNIENSLIIEIPKELDTAVFIASEQKETSPKTQMGPPVPGNISSIEEARAKKLSEQQHANTQWKIIDIDRVLMNKAIAQFESGDNYESNNITAWLKRWIKTDNLALWKYAITIGSLKGLGVIISGKGKVWWEKVSAYLKNPELQELTMEKYTDKSIKLIEENPKIIERIKNGETSAPELIAQWHLEWHGSIGKTRRIKDWLGTLGSHYRKKVAKIYFSLLEKKKLNNTFTVQPSAMDFTIPTIQAIQPEFKMPTPTIQESKETIKPAIQAIGPESQEISSLMPAPELEEVNNTMTSANDTIFVTKYATNSVISNIEDKRIQKNIREKLEQFDSEIEGLMAIEDNHRNKAMELEKQAKNLFGSNYEFNRLKLREKAKNEITIANNIRKVIMTMSKTKKAA